ncbi:MAG: hypothetical protein D3922_07000, partial [Candidatus Electrothrix sp. AR1]|nr:hypothetical protein [Candidatus Electrothrix sp. AR1]
MNKDLIITIFVPIGQGKEGKIGTGYPVAEDLILTSRHTVKPEQGTGQIQVRWHHLTDENAPDKGWITLAVEDIVWEGEGELDAVLLHCPHPEKAQGKGWDLIADKKPSVAKVWHSLGFSNATRYDNLLEPDNVSGTTESMADQADNFVLNVTSEPEDPAMWKGVSGMPVFVDTEILGVVRSVPENFNGKKLYAVPTWKMFLDDAFRECLGLDKQKTCEEQVEKDIESLPCSSEAESATKALAKQLEKIRNEYCQWIHRNSAIFNIAGLRLALPIAKAWVELDTIDQNESDNKTDSIPEEKKQIEQYRQWSRESERKRNNSSQKAEAVASGNKRVVITGGPGAGKSTLLKRLAHTFSHEGKIILWVRLPSLVKQLEGKTFEDALIRSSFDGSGISGKDQKNVSAKPDYLFADGLDECGTHRFEIIEALVKWGHGHQDTAIIITTRPFGHDTASFSDWKHYSILPLQEKDI